MTDISARTALVTGSTAGIGAATARLLAADGYHVIVSGRDQTRGAEVVDTITADGGTARFVRADLADLDSVHQLATAAGPLDVLVNNAGIFPAAPLVAQDVESFQASFDVNVRGLYFLTQAVAAGMAERGSGSIVNISTMAAQVAMPGLSVYSATKAAVESLTRTWAAELAASGVRVNAVAPGPTRTDSFVEMGEENTSAIAASTILGRAAEPEEIARVVVFVATDAGSYLTGATIAADAGRTAA